MEDDEQCVDHFPREFMKDDHEDCDREMCICVEGECTYADNPKDIEDSAYSALTYYALHHPSCLDKPEIKSMIKEYTKKYKIPTAYFEKKYKFDQETLKQHSKEWPEETTEIYTKIVKGQQDLYNIIKGEATIGKGVDILTWVAIGISGFFYILISIIMLWWMYKKL